MMRGSLVFGVFMSVVVLLASAFLSPAVPTRSEPRSRSSSRMMLMMETQQNQGHTKPQLQTRGQALKTAAALLTSSSFLFSLQPPSAALARGLPTTMGPSKAELLEKTRSKREDDGLSPEERKAKLAQVRKERMERQKQIEAEEEARKKNPNRKEVELDANLRSNYYYPTSRKRYLPKIKAAVDELPAARTAIEKGQWEQVDAYAQKEADLAALPLKLYASSLTGQGLSLDVSFVKTLNDQGDLYAKELDNFKKAVKAKDSGKATTALNKMEGALALYRKTARIDTPDGGVGEFPTDTKLGASFSNNNPTLYKKKN
jgi:hypothetical protein